MNHDNKLKPGVTRIEFINRRQETLSTSLLVKEAEQYRWLDKLIIEEEPIGTFLSEFLNTDFEGFGVTADFIGRFGFPSPCVAELDHLYTPEEATNLIQKVASEYILGGKSQIKLVLARVLQFCWGLDVADDIKRLSSLERYGLLSNYNAEDFAVLTAAYANRAVIKSQFRTSLAAPVTEILSDNTNSIGVVGLDNLVEVSSSFTEVYIANCHLNICLTELEEMLIENIAIRTCKNCGLWFVPIWRNDAEYCNRPINSTSTKTCKMIGPHKSFENKLKVDPVSMIYRRLYKKLHRRLTASEQHRITRAAFEGWKAEANQQMTLVKEGKITAEAFETWIKASEEKSLDR